MRSVTYSMGVSLDGFIVGPDGGFDWTAPDEEVFRFWIDEIREVGVHLLGRRLYETMLYWEIADQDASLDDAELEWAALWKPLPKVVFSATFSAASRHTAARRNRVSPSFHSLLFRSNVRGVLAMVKLATGEPDGVNLSSTSAVRLPITVMMVSFAMVTLIPCCW